MGEIIKLPRWVKLCVLLSLPLTAGFFVGCEILGEMKGLWA